MGDNAICQHGVMRSICGQCEGAAPRGRFVVIENTPGYLPDDDNPPTFDSFDEAAEYLREEAHRALADMEGEVVVGDSGYVSARPVLSLDRDAAGRPYSAQLTDVQNPYDLGRVWNVEMTEPDPGPVDESARLREAERVLRQVGRDDLASAVYAAGVTLGGAVGPVVAAGLTMSEAADLQEQAEREGWDDDPPCSRCGGGGEVAGFDIHGPGVGTCPACKGSGKGPQ